jgi:DinB family protein
VEVGGHEGTDRLLRIAALFASCGEGGAAAPDARAWSRPPIRCWGALATRRAWPHGGAADGWLVEQHGAVAPQRGSRRRYEGWSRVQAQPVARLPALGPEELQLRVSPDGWPVWAMLSHLAGTRVYWLCSVLGEPGIETTPFPDSSREGWEDHLDVPRQSDELLFALESSWRIVESCLERWTPEMLGEVFDRP